MLKNLSDYISLFTLIFITAYTLHIFLLSLLRREDDDNVSDLSKRQLLAEYLDNEEE